MNALVNCPRCGTPVADSSLEISIGTGQRVCRSCALADKQVGAAGQDSRTRWKGCGIIAFAILVFVVGYILRNVLNNL